MHRINIDTHKCAHILTHKYTVRTKETLSYTHPIYEQLNENYNVFLIIKFVQLKTPVEFVIDNITGKKMVSKEAKWFVLYRERLSNMCTKTGHVYSGHIHYSLRISFKTITI